MNPPEDGLSYGRLVPIASKLPVPKEPRLKDRKDFRLVGTGVPRIDGPAIVSGKAVYGLDVRVPGMLFAAVARCPVAGGKLARFDRARAMAVPGVRKVVEISTGVAVVATDSHAALSGRDALSATFDEGANALLTTEEFWEGSKPRAPSAMRCTKLGRRAIPLRRSPRRRPACRPPTGTLSRRTLL